MIDQIYLAQLEELIGKQDYLLPSEILILLSGVFLFFIFNIIQTKNYKVTAKIPGVNFKDLLFSINEGDKSGHIFMGISKETGGFIWRNLKNNPGFLVVGKQGGGKTVTLMTLLTVAQMTDGDKVFQILIDPSSKGFSGASELFGLDNTIKVVRDIKKTIPVFNMLYEEMEHRGRVFQALDEIIRLNWPEGRKILKGDPVDKYTSYNKAMPAFLEYFSKLISRYGEKSLTKEEQRIFELVHSVNLVNFQSDDELEIMGKVAKGLQITKDEKELLSRKRDFAGLAMIMIVFDEFSSYLQSDEVSFFEKSHEEGTVAFQIANIATKGRAMGLGYFIGTQSANRSVITREFKDSIASYVAHKVNDSDAASGIELPEASSLPNIQGRGVYNSDSGRAGTLHIPFVTPEARQELFKAYKGEFKGDLYAFSKEAYEGVSEGDGYSGYILNFPKLTQVLNTSSAFDLEGLLLLCKRILSLYDYEVEMDIREEVEINAYAIKDDKKYVLLVDFSKGRFNESHITNKTIGYIEKESEHLDVEGFIIFDFKKDSGYGTNELQNLVSKNGGYYLDFEDMHQICKVFQNRLSDNFERKKTDLVLSKEPIQNPRKEYLKSDSEVVHRIDEDEYRENVEELSFDDDNDDDINDVEIKIPESIKSDEKDEEKSSDLLSEDEIDDLFSRVDDLKD